MRGLRNKMSRTVGVITSIVLVANFTVTAIADTLDCSKFRHGPLFKRDMWQSSMDGSCKPLSINFDYGYQYQPDLFGKSFGEKIKCDHTELFSLNALDGPLYADPSHHKSPFNSDELRLLVHATNGDKLIESYLIADSDLSQKRFSSGTPFTNLKELGTPASSNSLGYQIIAHTWFDYDEIVVENERAYVNENEQLLIKRDAQNHITDVLSCGRETQMVNPGCDYYLATNNFYVEAHFNKKLLGDLDKIRENALTFTECLTVEK